LPLWEGCNYDDLVKKREELTEVPFNRGFRQIPYSSKDLMFPSFKNCIIENGVLPEINKMLIIVGGVDLSGKTRPGNVVFVLGVKPDGTRVPLAVKRGAWSSPETARQIIGAYKDYETNIILVESVALQGMLIEWIDELPSGKRPSGMMIKGFCTGSQKSHPELGLPGLEGEFEKNKWEIYSPKHDFSCDCGWCVWIREMKSYPFAATTDCVMACWFASEAIREWEHCKGRGNLGNIELSLKGEKRWDY